MMKETFGLGLWKAKRGGVISVWEELGKEVDSGLGLLQDMLLREKHKFD